MKNVKNVKSKTLQRRWRPKAKSGAWRWPEPPTNDNKARTGKTPSSSQRTTHPISRIRRLASGA